MRTLYLQVLIDAYGIMTYILFLVSPALLYYQFETYSVVDLSLALSQDLLNTKYKEWGLTSY